MTALKLHDFRAISGKPLYGFVPTSSLIPYTKNARLSYTM